MDVIEDFREASKRAVEQSLHKQLLELDRQLAVTHDLAARSVIHGQMSDLRRELDHRNRQVETLIFP